MWDSIYRVYGAWQIVRLWYPISRRTSDSDRCKKAVGRLIYLGQSQRGIRMQPMTRETPPPFKSVCRLRPFARLGS